MKVKVVYANILVLFMLCFATRNTTAQTVEVSFDTLQLEEITIAYRPSFQYKGDTMVYTADSFITGKNSVLHDVFKRMPNIEVTASGKIFVHGKEITGIYINGREATVGDIRNLIQNLPAHIIDEVQIMELYSEANRLTGSKDESLGKVVNLQLKKDAISGLYGRAQAGYGAKERLNANNFANYLADRVRLTSVGYVTNTNGGNVYDDNLASPPSGNTILKNGDLNYDVQSVGAKTRISGAYVYGGSNSKSTQNRIRKTFLPGDTIQQLQHISDNRINNSSHRLSTHITNELSSLSDLNSSLTLSHTKGGSLAINEDSIFYNKNLPNFYRKGEFSTNSHSNTISVSNSLKRRWQRSPRSLLLRSDISLLRTGESSVQTFETTALAMTNSMSRTMAKTEHINGTFYMQYSEPIGKRGQVIVDYSLNVLKNRDNKDVSVTDETERFTQDTVQSYWNSYSSSIHTGHIKYTFKSSHLSATSGLKLQSVKRTLELEKAPIIEDNQHNVSPLLNMTYTFPNASSIRLNYSGNFHQPGIQQLVPVPDYRDSLNIYIGNSSLKPEFRNNIGASLALSNRQKVSYAWINVSYSSIHNKIVENSTLIDNKRISSPINENGNYTLLISAGYTYTLAAKLRSIFNFWGTSGQTVNYTNSKRQVVTTNLLKPSCRIIYTSPAMDLDFAYAYSFNATRNAFIISGQHNNIASHILSINTKINLGATLSITLNGNYVSNDGYLKDNSDFLLLNIACAKEFKKVPGLTIKLQGVDICNNAPNLQRIVASNYIEDSQTNIVGRYIMFSLSYRYHNF